MNKASIEECTRSILPVRDLLDILSGKWKLEITASLMFGNRRFKDLQNHIHGINPKMLVKELRELEANELVKRTVYNASSIYINIS